MIQFSLAALTIMLLFAASSESALAQPSPDSSRWSATQVGNVLDRLERSGRRYESFVDTPTLSTGLYVLPAGAVDNQPVHELDEVYHVVEGEAVLKVGDDDVPVRPGSVVFVRAGIEHRFQDITKDLRVVVFFSKAIE